MLVRFRLSWQHYRAGETADLKHAPVARVLLRRGIVEVVEPEIAEYDTATAKPLGKRRYAKSQADD